MSTIVTRAGKGSRLTWAEADANFNNLNNDKVETSAIGTTVQAWSANLDEFAAVNPTAAGLALLDDVDAAAQRTTLDAQQYDADTLKADVADVLTAGFASTPYNAGTKSSGTFTPDEANGNMQYYVNGGAHTLAPPTNNTTIILQVTNNGSAGAITTSGFTKASGDSITTTNGDDFFFYITKCNGFSSLYVEALQ